MFFDVEVTIRAKRTNRDIAMVLPACVLDDGTGDPLSSSATSTERDNVCVYVTIDSWPEVEPPQIGDSLTLDGGERYAVRRVGRLADCYCLSARRA